MAKRGAGMHDIPTAVLSQYAATVRLMGKIGGTKARSRRDLLRLLPVAFRRSLAMATPRACKWSTTKPGRTGK
eukprot:12887060-Prorocentrum_lima.AAC.1